MAGKRKAKPGMCYITYEVPEETRRQIRIIGATRGILRPEVIIAAVDVLFKEDPLGANK
tara:strand:+ start:380 stop:556 length:177 start_codon:yes stop_codon:yes gene_type:complete